MHKNISVRFLLGLYSRDQREELAVVVQTGEQEYVQRQRYWISARVSVEIEKLRLNGYS